MWWFWRKRGVRATIDAVGLDTSGWRVWEGETVGEVRVWVTPEGDAVSVHFFDVVPDLPRVRSVGELTEVYLEKLKESETKVVECSLCRVAECGAVRLVIRAPQQGGGVIYQGAFTLPFRDFSFVIKVQCRESGVSGVKEAILLDEGLGRGDFGESGGVWAIGSGWNPDGPEHDGRFPDHPVARVRRVLERVAKTASVEAGVRGLPGFGLPGEGE